MKQLLLLITTQRCGSTWLFDLLRCHPRVGMMREARVSEKLGLNGFRYPSDLVVPEGGMEIQLFSRLGRAKHAGFPRPTKQVFRCLAQPRRIVRIPNLGAEISAVGGPDCWVEKFHPEFYGFEPARLEAGLDRLHRLYDDVRVLLLSRAPFASLGSHLSYRERNPSWYRHYDEAGVFELYERSYASLLGLGERGDCRYLDYGRLCADVKGVVGGLYRWCFPEEPIEEAERIAEYAIEQTARSRRSGTAFLSNQAGTEERYRARYAELFDRYEKQFERMNLLYTRLCQTVEGPAFVGASA